VQAQKGGEDGRGAKGRLLDGLNRPSILWHDRQDHMRRVALRPEYALCSRAKVRFTGIKKYRRRRSAGFDHIKETTCFALAP
jgi:hypothetical protein